MKDICYFDMDDTMCNFIKAYRTFILKDPRIIYPQSLPNFFENLEPIDGAIEAYHKLKEKYNVKILTRPSVHNPLCYTGKRIWVEKYLGFDECRNLILACDKTLLRGSYLIDDCEQTGLFKPEWEHIRYGSAKFLTWDEILKYLL